MPRLRYSLRVLLALCAAVAILAAAFANYVGQRKNAFAAITEAGGKIRMGLRGEPTLLERWFGSEAFGVVNSVDLHDAEAGDELIRHVARFTELRHLDLSNSRISDESLASITHLPLYELWLQDTPITDASAETLSRFKSLKLLSLNGTSLSDRFLERLGPLPDLEDLGLRGARVTSAGMAHLARHPKLKKLRLYRTEIDSAGVRHLVDCSGLTLLDLSLTKIDDSAFEDLGRLPKLECVDLNGNQSITTAAVREFQASRPECDVEWNGDQG